MPLVLKHQTRGQFLARLRADMRDSIGNRTVHVADRIVALIDAADLTDAEVRAAFALSSGQWTAAKNRFRNYGTARRTLRAAVGE